MKYYQTAAVAQTGKNAGPVAALGSLDAGLDAACIPR
jgi:hypothetical protein